MRIQRKQMRYLIKQLLEIVSRLKSQFSGKKFLKSTFGFVRLSSNSPSDSAERGREKKSTPSSAMAASA
mgnify:CR=1 FL=1